MINVTQSYLPPLEEYQQYLKKIWENSWLTNQGPLVQELEKKLKDYLGVENLLFVSNGTIAIQLVIKALKLKGEIITTPFSYVATTTSIIWENCTPVFADIEDQTFCINPREIEKHITPKTSAILATHVYGNACDVEKIETLAKKYNLKIIYDGAHAFGINIGATSVFNYGDVSTISFHATKLFHTIEGGAIITKDKTLAEKLFLYRSFGHIGDDYYSIGINGKNSEFHAAMGLCNLPRVNEIMDNRKNTILLYKTLLLNPRISFPEIHPHQNNNYSYFPVVFENEKTLLAIRKKLLENHISTRRYFYPSLNNMPYLKSQSTCPVSEDIAKRVLCLPLYFDIGISNIEHICKIVNSVI
jgi:dTDP-4-amino-4,6-dideoxygalactose transaminase